jgi:hypothetical protein
MSWGESGSGNQPQAVAAALGTDTTAPAAAVQHTPSTTYCTTFSCTSFVAVWLKYHLIAAYSAQFSAIQSGQVTTSTTAAGTATAL